MNTELGKKIKEQFELASLPSHMTHINNLNSILAANGLFSLNTLPAPKALLVTLQMLQFRL